MKEEHASLLVCPQCKGDLELAVEERDDSGRVKTGSLKCAGCSEAYPVERSVPRFVPKENYASNFGLEWTIHARTQYDSYSGSNVSETRFFEETKWPLGLEGEFILEAGSGSGRFTEQAVKTGATVVSLDYSYAVDANFASNGHNPNLLIVQGNILCLPFRPEFFDKVYCFGVLQHTPDPTGSFHSLHGALKSGGRLVVDAYKRHKRFKQLFVTKYWVRPFTKKMDPERLYSLCHSYVSFMWPISRLINRLPAGKKINWCLLVADYRGVYDLDEKILKEWAILDTFDMLSPEYDFPQSLDDVTTWFTDSGMNEVEVHYGFNGIEGRGVK